MGLVNGVAYVMPLVASLASIIIYSVAVEDLSTARMFYVLTVFILITNPL